MANDRLTQTDHDQLVDLMEAKFSELARLHDKLIAKAVEHYDANARSTDALQVVMAGHESGKAKVVRAMMELRFPEAAAAWFE